MVVGGFLRRIGQSATRTAASRPALAAGGGVVGGTLLDDVPILRKLDVTEGAGGGGGLLGGLGPLLILLLFVIALGSLFDIQVGE